MAKARTGLVSNGMAASITTDSDAMSSFGIGDSEFFVIWEFAFQLAYARQWPDAQTVRLSVPSVPSRCRIPSSRGHRMMELLFLLIGLAVGAAVAWIAATALGKGRLAAQTAELEAKARAPIQSRPKSASRPTRPGRGKLTPRRTRRGQPGRVRARRNLNRTQERHDQKALLDRQARSSPMRSRPFRRGAQGQQPVLPGTGPQVFDN